MSRRWSAVAVPVLALAVAGCGGTSKLEPAKAPPTSLAATPGSTVSVSTGTVSGLGTVLTDSQGRTLYAFQPDRRQRVTCTGTCAGVWTPLVLSSGQRLVASGRANRSMLGSTADPSGAGRVATYNGWPLYRFVQDIKAGIASGESVDMNGGLWYALGPSGGPA